MTRELIVNGFCVLIDADDYEWAHRLTWSVVWPNARCKHVYFYTTKQVRRVRVMPRLHRLIVKAKPGQIVDHINGDTLDNRKANLRVVAKGANIRNRSRFGINPLVGGSEAFKAAFAAARPDRIALPAQLQERRAA